MPAALRNSLNFMCSPWLTQHMRQGLFVCACMSPTCYNISYNRLQGLKKKLQEWRQLDFFCTNECLAYWVVLVFSTSLSPNLSNYTKSIYFYFVLFFPIPIILFLVFISSNWRPEASLNIQHKLQQHWT